MKNNNKNTPSHSLRDKDTLLKTAKGLDSATKGAGEVCLPKTFYENNNDNQILKMAAEKFFMMTTTDKNDAAKQLNGNDYCGNTKYDFSGLDLTKNFSLILIQAKTGTNKSSILILKANYGNNKTFGTKEDQVAACVAENVKIERCQE